MCLRRHGHEAYPVGGCVRDLLLGRQPQDWDVATSARPEEVMSLFARTVPTGLKHGTVTVLLGGGKVEVTAFRREGGYADGRHPDAVTFDAGLREDLSRRDFTINAMALAPGGGIIDLFGGQADLSQKIIRCVGSPAARFSEDALRMLRAVRFSAQLGFELEPATAGAVKAGVAGEAHLSAERVRAEVEQTITAPFPSRGGLLFSAGLLAPWLDGPVSPDLSVLSVLPPQPLHRWSGLCVLLGGTAFLERLKPDRHTAAVCAGVLCALRPPRPGTAADWRRALARYGAEVAAVAAAVMGAGEELERVLAAGPCYEIGALALTGGDLRKLGFRGPEIGRMQRALLCHVLEHPEDNRAEILRQLALRDQGSTNSFSNRP